MGLVKSRHFNSSKRKLETLNFADKFRTKGNKMEKKKCKKNNVTSSLTKKEKDSEEWYLCVRLVDTQSLTWHTPLILYFLLCRLGLCWYKSRLNSNMPVLIELVKPRQRPLSLRRANIQRRRKEDEFSFCGWGTNFGWTTVEVIYGEAAEDSGFWWNTIR